jgi:molybdopterin molybdotransferase
MALSQENVEFLFLGRARDELSDIEEKLKKGLKVCDLLIVTGGVSVGDYDYVKKALENIAVEAIIWRVAQRPGGPNVFREKRRNTDFWTTWKSYIIACLLL